MEEIQNPEIKDEKMPSVVEVSAKPQLKGEKKETVIQKIMKPFGKLWEMFNTLPSNKKTLILAILIIVFLLASALVAYAFIQLSANERSFSTDGSLISEGNDENTSDIEDPAPQDIKDQESPLNGVLYTKNEITELKKRYPLAIVVENHIDARPQSGLNKADIVYELLAEGGITRFVSIYWGEQSTEVGPVRSARKYMVDIVGEYDALFEHIGWAANTGNAETDAEAYIYSTGTKSFLWSGYTWRSKDRVAPHNAYTDTSKLWDQATGKGWTTDSYSLTSWKYKNDKELEERPLTSTVELTFSSSAGSYGVKWAYDRNTNIYKRENAGASFIDKPTGLQIEAKDIIVMQVEKSIPKPKDSSNRIILDVIGSGKVVIFRDGEAIEGTWEKSSRTARTIFKDNDGEIVELNRGKIWVEMVPVKSGKLEGTLTYN